MVEAKSGVDRGCPSALTDQVAKITEVGSRNPVESREWNAAAS